LLGRSRRRLSRPGSFARDLEVAHSRLTESVAVLDKHRTVLSMNPVMERVLGWQRGEALGVKCPRALVRFGTADFAPCDVACPLLTPACESENTVAHEIEIEDEDGLKRRLALRCWCVRSSADGQVYGLVSARDVTASRGESSSRNELISVLAHELRTPLTSIKGCASTLLGHRQMLGEERTEDFLRIINDQSDRLRDLIDNVLDLSRIESGTLKVRREPLEVVPLIERVVADFRLRVRDRSVLVESTPGLPRVWADARRIEQVVNNLLDNAIKYSPSPEPVVVKVALSGSKAVISVRDKGPGIPAHEIERVFDKFYRIENAASKHIRGSGLGLSICRGLVEAHGGDIWAESRVGDGSVFRFTLPLWSETAKNGDTGTEDPASAPLAAKGASEPGEPPHVLIAAEDERLARVLRAGLEAAEYRSSLATALADVVAKVREGRLALLVLGEALADAPGLDALRRLREFSSLPILFVDAQSVVGRRRALENGADEYLAWPFGTNDLLAKTRAVLLQRSTTSSSMGGLVSSSEGKQKA